MKSEFSKKMFGEHKITLKLMDADTAWDHFMLVLDILAPFMGGMLDEKSKDEMIDMYHKPSFWKDSLGHLSTKLRDPAVKAMCEEMLGCAQCGGEKLSLSHTMFRGNMSLVMEVFIWAVMENFGEDLLGKLSGIGGLIGSVMQPTAPTTED